MINNSKLVIPIKFGWRWVIFFIALETLTVPWVAYSNDIVISNVIYMCIMGFMVAFACVLLLLWLMKKLIIKYSEELFGIKITKVVGVWYIAILAGILEMIMFGVQDLLFSWHWDDYRVGFVSAFVSVGLTLWLYFLSVRYTKYHIKMIGEHCEFRAFFGLADIVKFAWIFGLYEFIVCPITGIWVPIHHYRVLVATISGLVGGASGGVLLMLISHYWKSTTPCLTLLKIDQSNVLAD